MQSKLVVKNEKEKSEQIITVKPTLKPVMKCSLAPNSGTKKNNKNK